MAAGPTLGKFDAKIAERLEETERSRADAHEKGDTAAEADALLSLSAYRRLLGDGAGVLSALNDAAAVAERGAHDALLARILRSRARVRPLAQAAQSYEDCSRAAEICQRLRDPAGFGDAFIVVASIQSRLGDFPGSAKTVEVALDALRHAGGKPLIQGLTRAANLEIRRKRWVEADALLSEADAEFARSDLPPAVKLSILNLQLMVAGSRHQIMRAVKLFSRIALGVARLRAKGVAFMSLRSSLRVASRIAKGSGGKGLDEKKVLAAVEEAKTVFPSSTAAIFGDDDDEKPA